MSKFELKNIKGTKDFLPEEQIIRNNITKTLENVFLSYGYLPLETSTLCYYDLLASKYAGGAEILKEVYKFNDQGNREIGLRYDLTVPFAKVISMNKSLTLPFRRYEIGKVFRDGPVKVGRDREFYQCDVDVCGLEGSLVEAELMSLAFTGYNKLGIDIIIEWNNRKFLSGLIKECGIEEEIISSVILSVDKLAKIGEDGVIKELEDLGIDISKLNQLFEYFKLDIKNLFSKFNSINNELLLEGLNEVKELNDILSKLGLKDCKFTPYLARGLEIYTGTVFEVFDKEKRITSALGAGGRYDKIITNFIGDGNKYPAVGLSFGLVPIYELLSKKDNSNNNLYDLFIIPMDTQIESLKFTNTLREKGIKVLMEMKSRKLKKSLDWANKNNIPFVIIIGDNEINSNKVTIKVMSDSTGIEVSMDDIDKIISIIKKSSN